uniref:Uncharacterized protein n=1 Tax=Rhizophagus irregularis (strain DAOM 181602 / DAOM 197198 / MUCL 43194) TaxID=747089 RepID=U9UGQ7_RHIID
MYFPKYDGNIHPDEWINDIQKFRHIHNLNDFNILKTAILLIDPTIKLPAKISNIEELRNALKGNISFAVFRNTNKRKLQLLKYIPESRGGDTSKFISKFFKLCYNAEIDDVEEQKKYLCKSLPMMGCCDYSSDNCWDDSWKFNDSELEDHQGYLKSNDIINLSIEKRYDNNKWCIELIKQHNWTIDNLQS